MSLKLRTYILIFLPETYRFYKQFIQINVILSLSLLIVHISTNTRRFRKENPVICTLLPPPPLPTNIPSCKDVC